MLNIQFVRRQMKILVVAYGCFCVAFVSALFWAENFIFKEVTTAGSLGFIPMISVVRGLVLFLTGLPFIAFLIKRQIEQENLACTDDLTGLCNHRQILNALDRELARAKRYHQELSVIVIDIDNFKNINDRYGHLAGDQILQEMGTIFARGIREVDVVGRYGGDEFLMILPHTGHNEAQRLAWRLCSSAHDHPFKIGGEKVRVSISLGISSLQDLEEETDRFSLIHRADQAMFSVKNEKHFTREKVKIA